MVVSFTSEVGLLELGVGVVRGDELLDEGLVGGLGEPALLVDEGHDAHRLLDQVDRGLEVEAEVDELPLDALALVLFLLKDEHLR